MLTIFENSTEEIHDPFRLLAQKWYGVRHGRLYPSLENFINEVSELEDYRMLSTIKTDPLQVEYYEAGRSLEKLYGSSLKKNLDELYNDWFRKRAYEGYSQLLNEKLPIYEQHGFSTIVGRIGYYKIHLPFGDDMITSAATYIMPTSGKFKKRFDWESLIKKTPWF